MTDPIIFKASKRAAILHLDQKRKDGSPYFGHLASVALIVAHYSDDPELIAAGFLHDAIEDVSKEIYSEADLLAEFGERILKIVLDLSDKSDPMSVENKIATWKERKLKYIAHMETEDLDTLLVCCADKIHNARGIVENIKREGQDFYKKFHTSKAEVLWYYDECLRIIQQRMPGEAAEELAFYVKQLK